MGSTSKREAEERLNEWAAYLLREHLVSNFSDFKICDDVMQGFKKIEEIFAQERKVVDDLLNISKTLRAMPVINLESPTLCHVGAPNVGKSSLVHVLSTGKPEVCRRIFECFFAEILLTYTVFSLGF